MLKEKTFDITDFKTGISKETGKVDSNDLVAKAEAALDKYLSSSQSWTVTDWYVFAQATKVYIVGDEQKNMRLFNDNKAKGTGKTAEGSQVEVSQKRMFETVQKATKLLCADGFLTDKRIFEYGVLARTRQFREIANFVFGELVTNSISQYKAMLYKNFLVSTVGYKVKELMIRGWKVYFTIFDKVAPLLTLINANSVNPATGYKSVSASYQVSLKTKDKIVAMFKSTRPDFPASLPWSDGLLNQSTSDPEVLSTMLLAAACTDVHKLFQSYEYKAGTTGLHDEICGIMIGIMNKFSTLFSHKIEIPAITSNLKDSEFCKLWFDVKSMCSATHRSLINFLWPQGRGKTVERKGESKSAKVITF